VGGTEKYLQTIIPALMKRGHQVALVYERAYDPAGETIDDLEVSESWCLAELSLKDLIGHVTDWKPEIIYSQGLENMHLEDALLNTFPTVLFGHGYYGTCGTGSKCHTFPRTQPCDRRFGPACVLLHYPRRCGGLNPWQSWRTFRRQYQRYRRLSDYKCVIVASTHMYREFQLHGVGSGKLHLVLLPAAEGQLSPPLPKPKIPQDQILLIGRLTTAKGGHYLIPAIRQASERLKRSLTLIVAGDGPERRNLEGLALRLNVRVNFTGWLDAARKWDLLNSIDLLAVPSLWPEPFGLVGLEAGVLGVPGVAYAVGGITEWLIPGRSGEVAPGNPPTVNGLADAIVRALAEPDHYADLCVGARQVSQRFSLSEHLTKIEEVLGCRNCQTHPKSSSPN
jgi:glycosyltransferase involved in cell wall biosynthesis